MRPLELRRKASRNALRFHTAWIQFLAAATPRTLKRVAHELSQLEQANAGYRDGKIFQVLRQQLEATIQEVGPPGCKWSVAASRRDLRGRTGRKSRTIHVNRDVQLSLDRKLSLLEDQGEL